MKFYTEERFVKYKNILSIVVLILLSLFLFFKVYSHFEKSIQIIMSTIVPFALSFVIVYSLMPFIDLLVEKFDFKRNFAILIVLSIFFALLIYIILAFIPLIGNQISSLIEFFIKNQETVQNNVNNILVSSDIDMKKVLLESKDVILGEGFKILNSSFSWFSSMFSLLFMTPIFTIMLIFSYESMDNGVKNLLIKMDQEEWIPLIKKIDDAIGKYIKVTMLDSIIVGIASYIIFFFLKMEYSLLFSLIIGMGNFIPFIGPFIGLIPVILFAFTKSWKLVVMIVVLITVVQTIEANIVKPWLTSKSVDIHPITTLLVVLIGGALFGIAGAFLAIPVYIIIKLTVIYYFEKNSEK